MVADNNITNEMKRHTVRVSIKVEYSDLKVARFLKVTRSFIYQMRKELKENNEDKLAMSKRKQDCQCSDSLITPGFVKRVHGMIVHGMIVHGMIAHGMIDRAHGMIDENPGKSRQHLAKDLQVSEGTIRNIVHQDLRYKSYILR